MYSEYRFEGCDGATYTVWDRTDKAAIKAAKSWGGRHGGILRIDAPDGSGGIRDVQFTYNGVTYAQGCETMK